VERDRREHEITHPEWDVGSGSSGQLSAAPRISWRIVAGAVVGLGALLAWLLLAGQQDAAVRSQPLSPELETSTTSTPIPRTEVIAELGTDVLGVSIGAALISTDFDDRIVVTDLDTGVVTRTMIRTGRFQTAAGQLVAETECGGWQAVDLVEYELAETFIGCGSYRPVEQRGADALLFSASDQPATSEVLIADGQGGLLATSLLDESTSTYATASGARVLVESADGQLVWIDAVTGESKPYASGHLIEAGPGGVLWTECELPADCGYWFGNPLEANVRRFAIDAGGEPLRARINNQGTRAVFFLPDDLLRIVTLETGHARELQNPGVDLGSATWSPDGLWLVGQQGPDVIALNTLNGRTASFAGVTGDGSPGWLALVESS